MSIATKTGDKGTTGMLFGARVSKSDKRIAAVGDIDELNAAIGLIRPKLKTVFRNEYYHNYLVSLQRQLTWFMGEIVTEPEKRAEYVEKYTYVTKEDLDRLDGEIARIEKDMEPQKDWAMYGQSDVGASCDFASKVCRRAERSFLSAKETEEEENTDCPYRPILSMYINRLSDFLHLLARYFDTLHV